MWDHFSIIGFGLHRTLPFYRSIVDVAASLPVTNAANTAIDMLVNDEAAAGLRGAVYVTE